MADFPERLTLARGTLRLLLLGSVEHGGAGRLCPASSVLRELVHHGMLSQGEVVLLDLCAGVEHLGRATADSVDVMLVVAGPNPRSISIAHQVRRTALEFGIERLLLVGNGIRDDADADYFMNGAKEFQVAGLVYASAQALAAERAGQTLYSADPFAAAEISAIADAIQSTRYSHPLGGAAN